MFVSVVAKFLATMILQLISSAVCIINFVAVPSIIIAKSFNLLFLKKLFKVSRTSKTKGA